MPGILKNVETRHVGEQYLQQIKYPPPADPPNTLVEPPLPHDELFIRKYYQLMMNKLFISITNF